LEARKLEGRFGDSVLAFQLSSIMAFQPNICEVNMEEQVRAHVIITGRVQGVFFRVETQRAAEGFGVSGWVRNKRDGTVEAVFEGRQEDVDATLNWCRQGPRMARVDKVDINWQDYTGEFESFDVTY
jgi:acylphosphatase